MTPKSKKSIKKYTFPSPKSAMNKAKILGIGINSTSYDGVITWINQKLEKKQKFFLATPNPEMLVAAQKDPDFASLLNRADVAIPDGFGLVVASRLLKTDPQISQTVTGTDLVEKIASLASQNHWKLFFLGGRPGIAEKTSKRLSIICHLPQALCQFSPGPQQLQFINGKLEIGDRAINSQTVIQINKFQPHLLFVAFGHGKQESWIISHLPYLKIGGAIGVGGAFDYLSGTTPRAPFVIRKLGFEWLFRLIYEPNRWKRILNAVVIFPFIVLLEKSHQE